MMFSSKMKILNQTGYDYPLKRVLYNYVFLMYFIQLYYTSLI